MWQTLNCVCPRLLPAIVQLGAALQACLLQSRWQGRLPTLPALAVDLVSGLSTLVTWAIQSRQDCLGCQPCHHPVGSHCGALRAPLGEAFGLLSGTLACGSGAGVYVLGTPGQGWTATLGCVRHPVGLSGGTQRQPDTPQGIPIRDTEYGAWLLGGLDLSLDFGPLPSPVGAPDSVTVSPPPPGDQGRTNYHCGSAPASLLALRRGMGHSERARCAREDMGWASHVCLSVRADLVHGEKPEDHRG